jgi:hypothetical protein
MEQAGNSDGMPMPSPKLIQILRSKTKLTDEQIIGLSETEGWAEVRKVDEQRRAEREANKKPEICFTGFNGNEREELETAAVIKGYKVRTTVTKNLDILVLGEAPGVKKIEKAEAQGVSILQLDEYEKLAAPNRVIEEAAIESMATYEPKTPTAPSKATPKRRRLPRWLKLLGIWLGACFIAANFAPDIVYSVIFWSPAVIWLWKKLSG